jgi:hypothetical protein
MKSSVNAEELLIGRPHGGIGFIANRQKNITYKPITIDSDRITGVQVISGGKTLLTVFGVYLPYYNGHNDQIQLYSETLDILQSSIDAMDPSPMMIVGDMNAPLPKHIQLSRFWYRQHPYNKHSYILYDFLRNNDLKAANFNFDQDVSYTYFNATSQSYIDHVFSSSCAGDIIKQCSIMSDLPTNVSDHYPLLTSVELQVQTNIKHSKIVSAVPKYPRMNWSDNEACVSYSRYVTDGAKSLPIINFDAVNSHEEAQKVVDSMCGEAIDVMHESCSKLLSDKHARYKGRFKPNSWWNKDCLITRDRQRFWFSIWKACGRPREGQVYLCYKSAKKVYRSTCNQAMNGSLIE